MDIGFRDLFQHDPDRASAMLDVSLPPEAIQRIRQRLDRIETMSQDQRARLTSAVSSLERWKQE